MLTEAMRDCIYDDRFDSIMLTHYHRKHSAMIYRLSHEYYLDRLILPEPETEEEEHHLTDLLLLAEDEGITVEFYSRGETFSLAGMMIETLPRITIDRSTHPLIGVRFMGENRCAAYLGAEAYSVSNYGSGTLLIFGGHGPLIRDDILLPETAAAVAISKDAYDAFSEDCSALLSPVFSYVMRSLR